MTPLRSRAVALACVALVGLLLLAGCKPASRGRAKSPKGAASASVQKFTPLTWHEIVGPNGGFPTQLDALEHFGGALPEDLIIRNGRIEQFATRPFFTLSREPVITSDDIDEVEVVDVGYGPTVGFTLTPEAGERFRAYTREHIDTGLAIVMDSRVISNPVIRSEIGEKGVISGNFTPQEVEALAERLRP